MLEILLLFFGLRALITGTFNVGGGEATGLGARIAGLILILPIPITVLIVVGGIEGNETEDFFSYYWNNGIFWVELGLIAGCSLVGYTVASVSAFSRRGYGSGEMRYRTEARDDIYIPPSSGPSLPSLKKGARRPPRKSSREELDEPEVVKEVEELEEIEEAEPRPRRRRRPPRREYEDEDEDDYEAEEDDWRPRKHSRRVLWTVLAASVGLILLGGVVLIAVLNSDSLKRYNLGEPGRKFRVRMPKGATKDEKDGGRTVTVEAKEPGGLHYLLKVRKVEPPSGLDAKESWLDGFRPVYARDGLSVTNETRTLWDSDSPGRLLGGNVTGSTTQFRARIWLVEDRIYFLIVRGSAAEVVSENATRFLDSLELPYHPRSR